MITSYYLLQNDTSYFFHPFTCNAAERPRNGSSIAFLAAVVENLNLRLLTGPNLEFHSAVCLFAGFTLHPYIRVCVRAWERIIISFQFPQQYYVYFLWNNPKNHSNICCTSSKWSVRALTFHRCCFKHHTPALMTQIYKACLRSLHWSICTGCCLFLFFFYTVLSDETEQNTLSVSLISGPAQRHAIDRSRVR